MWYFLTHVSTAAAVIIKAGTATVLMKMKEETTEETGEENAEEAIDLEETKEDTTTKESSILILSLHR